MFEKDLIALSVKVLEAYSRDVGNGIARMDRDCMKSLKLSEGDTVQIQGKRRTAATCMRLYPSDEGIGIIRIDGLIRNNCRADIGDTIIIKKINASAAEEVVVVPLEEIPPVDERILAESIGRVPLIIGDHIMVRYFGGRLTFQVKEVTPDDADAVIVTEKTRFEIADRILSQVETQAQTLAGKIYSLIEQYDKQLISLLEEQTVSEVKLIETFDKIKKLNEISTYLSQMK